MGKVERGRKVVKGLGKVERGRKVVKGFRKVKRGRKVVKGLGKGERKDSLREYGVYVCVCNEPSHEPCLNLQMLNQSYTFNNPLQNTEKLSNRGGGHITRQCLICFHV